MTQSIFLDTYTMQKSAFWVLCCNESAGKMIKYDTYTVFQIIALFFSN